MDPSASPGASRTAEEALRRFLAEHSARLRQLVERRCPTHLGIDPADVEQEVLLRVWRTLERESELRAPTSFLYRVVATALVDAVRRRRARPEEPLMLESRDSPGLVHEPPAATPSPEEAASRTELIEAVERQLAAMSDQRRLAVKLHLQGFDTTEIGRLARWTEPKARNLVYRGLEELRQRLREQGIDYAND
jgi:RNA polymerase sigma-70 factor (ECF subfamily)